MFFKRKKKAKKADDDTEVLPAIKSDDRWDVLDEGLEEIRRSQLMSQHNRSVMRKKKTESERRFLERARKHRYGQY